MLDPETKRRIDTCRDILVGKVPDPKSQVEQITIALIYKFMDDMDGEAEELGGSRSFFTGEFAKYGWSKLMAPGMGGFDVLSLYSEAIQKMNENPGVPALFREIFKNAFLPYRDPETLRSFLKEINSFTYDHSERLGDAFEYLLSVLGSQGEAGQFRTPRHIIDFMVEIVDPKKDETILDPACGTAGFLISSYKHILKHNSREYREQQDREAYDEKGVPIEELPIDNPLRYSGDLLTPDDRKRLAADIGGYDISPDMVRLSLVNMYLHGFIDPHIEEYDTLTSDEKWSELADVILANPPFMSPKGGIKPHKRFSVQSKRSEVLFVDYIAEHLTPNGRAAVVVPEGIIFQGQTAYKQLREMLVKGYLVAVVSLPAGVFNPYSGVKTSILVLDKRLAKQRDKVLFVKIDNDGFNLGAQRRPIDRNDLPEAVRTVKAFLQQGEVAEQKNVLAVSRERIGENGEWNLSADRYLENIRHDHRFEFVPLAKLCEYVRGVTYKKSDEVAAAGLKVLRANNIDVATSSLNLADLKEVSADITFGEAQRLRANDILMCASSGSAEHVGKVAFSEGDTDYYFGGFMAVLRCNDRVIPKYLFENLKVSPFRQHLSRNIAGANINNIKASIIHSYEIPLPPLEVQKEIVAEIEGYQKIIDGARQVVENYQPRIPIHPDWPMVALEDVSERITDGDHQPPPKSDVGVPFITISNVRPGEGIDFSNTFFVPDEYYEDLKEYRRPRKGDVLYTVTGSFGIPVLVDFESKFCFQRHIGLIRPSSEILSEYLYFYLQSPAAFSQAESSATGVAQKTVSLKSLRAFSIPLPDKETQQNIVEEISAEQGLVNANKELIQRFEEKIKQTINRVWGEAE